MEASGNIPNSTGITSHVYVNKCKAVIQHHVISDMRGFVLG